MEPSTPPPAKPAAWAPKIALLLAGLLVLGWFLRGFLWNVLEALMLNVVPILFTPVILELTVGFVGLFIVLLFCHLRKKTQQDEWVYISKIEPEKEMEQIPEPLRRRVAETILKNVPLAVDTDELRLQPIEGLIELGLLEEAEKELLKGSEADRHRAGFVRLRLLVMLEAERWDEADTYAASRPAAPESLALTCVEAARFFISSKPARKASAAKCLELGKALSPNAVVNAIDSDWKLQKLA